MKIGILLIGLILSHCSIYSQEPGTFRGYGQIGFNTNQISGDSISGFTYFSLRGGAGSYFMVSKKLSVNLEINYTQRGASGEVFDALGQFMYHRAITTDYIEVPLLINYHDGNIARFGAGFAVASLLNSRTWYNKRQYRNDTLSNLFKPIDFSFVASVSFDIQKHFGANFRMTHSIIPFNNKRNAKEEDQYHISLSANAIYYF